VPAAIAMSSGLRTLAALAILGVLLSAIVLWRKVEKPVFVETRA
jgi:hypothetical protein